MARNNQYPVILGMTPPNKQGIGIKSKLGSGYDLYILDDENTAYPIVPKTVSQYTGLKDKNGNRIWENDIVSFIDCSSTESGYVEHNCVGRVAWDCECASFRVSGTLSAEAWEVLQDCVVIGNIFDNPELLKGE